MNFPKRQIIFLLFLACLPFKMGSVWAETSPVASHEEEYEKVKAKVIEVLPVVSSGTDSADREQVVAVQILSGQEKGRVLRLDNSLLSKPWPDIVLKQNDKVVVTLVKQDGKLTNAFISDYWRSLLF